MTTSLDVTYASLRREIGRFLGFSRDPSTWGTNETTDVTDILAAGLRQFYHPPQLEGERSSYQWSFLRPNGNVIMEADVPDYDMPEDFAGLDGGLFFVKADFSTIEVTVVNISKIKQLRMREWNLENQYWPRYAALSPLMNEGASRQITRLSVWPTPDSTYTLNFKYFVRANGLDDENGYPLGGPEHAETIRASCIAAAEASLDDEMGTKHQRFMMMLRASMNYDRKVSSPQTIGYNGDRESRRNWNSNGECSDNRSSGITPYIPGV